MKRKQRIELIHLLSEELCETANTYDKAAEKQDYVTAGYQVNMFNSKEAIKRRITSLRAELLELSKSL